MLRAAQDAFLPGDLRGHVPKLPRQQLPCQHVQWHAWGSLRQVPAPALPRMQLPNPAASTARCGASGCAPHSQRPCGARPRSRASSRVRRHPFAVVHPPLLQHQWEAACCRASLTQISNSRHHLGQHPTSLSLPLREASGRQSSAPKASRTPLLLPHPNHPCRHVLTPTPPPPSRSQTHKSPPPDPTQPSPLPSPPLPPRIRAPVTPSQANPSSPAPPQPARTQPSPPCRSHHPPPPPPPPVPPPPPPLLASPALNPTAACGPCYPQLGAP